MKIEEKSKTENDDIIPPLSASSLMSVDHSQSCGMNLPISLRAQDDSNEKEEKSPSSKETGEQPDRRVDLHSLWKTSLCSFFRQASGGSCGHGDSCRYAHGEDELRPRPDNSWDPTSERAKKLLKTSDGYTVSGVAEDICKARKAPMEIEEKPATPRSESDDITPPLSASLLVAVDDSQSCGMNLQISHSAQDGSDEKEEKSPSSKDTGEQPNRRVDLHSLWKTSLCSFFRQSSGGSCRHGDSCRYAHGEDELRPRPDNSWDPTSERAKKLLKTNDGHGVSGVAEDKEDAPVDFTSIDKCLLGLPKNWANDSLKSFLDGKGISYRTAKKKKGMTVGFVSFEDAADIRSAIEVLNANPINYKQVKVADAVCRSQKKKQKTESILCSSNTEDGSLLAPGDDAAFSTSNVEGVVTKTKAVRDVVTPLARMPYKDQLEYKRNSLRHILKRLTRNARKACSNAIPLPEWVLKSREIGGLPCKLEGVLESPLVDGYRNKCEFSVGCSLEGKLTVGFMLGNFREGVTAVEEPGGCPNVSRISCEYAMLFQDFLQSSELPAWNRINNNGFWRQFTVREGRCPGQESAGIEIAEVMLIIQVCSLSYDEEQIKREFNQLAHVLPLGAAACSPPLPLTAIVVQDHRGISNVAPADCPLIALQLPNSEPSATTETRIHDHIGNLRFSISPTAFFQVNTLAAERLFSLAGDWAELSPDTILFDICCGTGTIGLTLAHRVGMVVGIEMNESAVSDANRNAEINGIKNCRFICGKAEDVIGSMLKEYLDAPENHGVVSEYSGSNGASLTGNETNRMNHEEGDGSVNKLADSTERNYADWSSEKLLTGTDDSLRFAGKCAEECISTTKQNEGSRETIKQNLENILPEGSTATNASVHHFKRVVAIVDPPRAGLHPTVIKALRTHPRIRRLVYISCNPDTLIANAIELCTPTTDKQEKCKGNKGWRNMSNAGLARHRVKSMPSSEAFRPVRAIGVDLFPHTPHCEMVMLLER